MANPPPKNVVFDSNLWVSYFIKRNTARLAQIVLENDLTVFTSDRLVAELEEVLSYPHIAQKLELPVEEYIHFHRNLATHSRVHYAFRGSPDPKDDYLFDLAISAEATHLVTNDKILLNLGQVRSVNIVSPETFFGLLSKV